MLVPLAATRRNSSGAHSQWFAPATVGLFVAPASASARTGRASVRRQSPASLLPPRLPCFAPSASLGADRKLADGVERPWFHLFEGCDPDLVSLFWAQAVERAENSSHYTSTQKSKVKLLKEQWQDHLKNQLGPFLDERERAWLELLSQEDLDFVNAQLTEELMRDLGLELVRSADAPADAADAPPPQMSS